MYNRQSTIKQDLVQDKNEPSYWTQYTRTHSLLGAKRGAGVPRDYPNRSSYNVLTGNVFILSNLVCIFFLNDFKFVKLTPYKKKVKKIDNQVGVLLKDTTESQAMFFSIPDALMIVAPLSAKSSFAVPKYNFDFFLSIQ